jgi:hypothetical protein
VNGWIHGPSLQENSRVFKPFRNRASVPPRGYGPITPNLESQEIPVNISSIRNRVFTSPRG